MAPSAALHGPKSPATDERETPAFSHREAKRLVQDLFTPKPALYWADFLMTVSIGYGFAAIYLMAPAFSVMQIVAFLVSGLALFRVGIFIHELVHREEPSMIGFHIAWNLLFGVPFLLHSLLYRSHLDHHYPRKFGTPAEGEYLPLASAPIRETVLYLAQIPVVPLLAAFRFLVLVPLSFLYPPSRRWLLEQWSSYTINPYYRRVIPSTEPLGLWAALDLLCLLWLVVVIGLIFKGFIVWTTVGMVYGLSISTIALNWVRTLAAHRFLNTGGNMTYVEQIEDSQTIEGRSLLTLLLFPIGLRYHALHHLFPLMPYHSMGEAHRRLMSALTEDSPYKKGIFPSLWAALRELLRGARVAGKAGQNPMQAWRHPRTATYAR
ncbi:fatty acid desaturase [Candidatus Methylomirabilis limnetica]|uniref:Fatty acid desaturase n=1 Tax=Candidatus Methylomirabilis limnetica TaxID=2033718 RepID=A0A2T4TYI4_9BACT|nr:fatty acid desaturase [Candidatus Methylomirabilis limnetica]PTL36177.1 fatty acid desaturase [Candidatus Methylomirabilis limnetica]